jgi:hypothetical protein
MIKKKILRNERKKSEGRVKNATKNVLDGIEFKSKLETYCYQQLQKHNIKAEYEGVRYEILPSFTYQGEVIRRMSYTPDFVGDGFIIECKGLIGESLIKKRHVRIIP